MISSSAAQLGQLDVSCDVCFCWEKVDSQGLGLRSENAWWAMGGQTRCLHVPYLLLDVRFKDLLPPFKTRKFEVCATGPSCFTTGASKGLALTGANLWGMPVR